MSEAETHEHEEDEAAGEPVSLETVTDEEEAEAEAAESHEPSEEQQEASSAPRDPKEIERALKKIATAHTTYANRVSVILGEDANDLVPCELCSHFVAGFHFPGPQNPEIVARTLAAIGMGSLGQLRESPYQEICKTCEGEGEYLTGSKRPEQRAITCEDCNARGWVRREDAPPASAPMLTFTQPQTFANGGEVTITEGAIDPAEAKRRMDAAIAQAKGGG